jgi:hypothetical protein
MQKPHVSESETFKILEPFPFLTLPLPLGNGSESPKMIGFSPTAVRLKAEDLSMPSTVAFNQRQ